MSKYLKMAQLEFVAALKSYKYATVTAKMFLMNQLEKSHW